MTESFTKMCRPFTLVIGGASSGKSDFSEKICLNSGLRLNYLATAQVFDEEMRTKVERHRTSRGSGWHTIEAPFDIAIPLSAFGQDDVVLIDCATLWLTNHLLADHDIKTETETLLTAISQSSARIVMVTNEVGQGIVPENALARRFRDEQGRLNRRLAEAAETVIGVMAGLPFVLKGDMPDGVK